MNHPIFIIESFCASFVAGVLFMWGVLYWRAKRRLSREKNEPHMLWLGLQRGDEGYRAMLKTPDGEESFAPWRDTEAEATEDVEWWGACIQQNLGSKVRSVTRLDGKVN